MEFEVERIIEKRFISGKVQYRVKWKGYSSKKNSWVNSDDMNCDELIDEFEKARAEKIVGATKANGDVFYMVRMKGLIHPEKVCSTETRNKWPMLIIDFLEKNIVLVADTEQNDDQGIMAGCISLAQTTVGEPLALHYVTDVTGELQYLFEWPNQEYRFVESSEAVSEWPEMVIDFLESMLNNY